MLLDLLIGIPILFFILIGFRDGIVRKLVAIVVLIAALVLAQIYMRDVGNLIAGNKSVDKESSSTYGFLIIYFGLFIIQSLFYKFVTKSYKIGGFSDRIGGLVLGFFEGALIVSSLLYIFAFSNTPSYRTKHDSRFYKSVVNIAPVILDFTSTSGPEAIEKIKEIGTQSDSSSNVSKGK
jgi:membrane protein required for colicin V production